MPSKSLGVSSRTECVLQSLVNSVSFNGRRTRLDALRGKKLSQKQPKSLIKRQRIEVSWSQCVHISSQDQGATPEETGGAVRRWSALGLTPSNSCSAQSFRVLSVLFLIHGSPRTFSYSLYLYVLENSVSVSFFLLVSFLQCYFEDLSRASARAETMDNGDINLRN